MIYIILLTQEIISYKQRKLKRQKNESKFKSLKSKGTEMQRWGIKIDLVQLNRFLIRGF